MFHRTVQVQIVIVSLTVKKKYMRDALLARSKTYMETAKIRLLAKKNAMVDLERFRVDWEYASVTMPKTLMTFVTISAERKPPKFPSPLMEKFKFMTLQPEQPRQHPRKSQFVL